MKPYPIHYVRQTDYPYLPYPTTLDEHAQLKAPYPSVKQAGCGLCSMCMVLEGLTGIRLTVEDMIAMAVEAGANRNGTDMKVLGAYAAGQYDLEMVMTDDDQLLVKCLKEGGLAVLHVGHPDGLFSDGGHYLAITGITDGRLQILDPSYTKEKYGKEYRIGKYEMAGEHLSVTADILLTQCDSRSPAFYLFRSTGPRA